MKIMADLDAVHLGLDENEADIAEELQDFDDSFDTRSEASESGSESSDSQPSISSVSTATSSLGDKRKNDKTKKSGKELDKKTATATAATTKRASSPSAAVNGKSTSKKKREGDSLPQKRNEAAVSVTTVKSINYSKEKKSSKKSSNASANTNNNSAGTVANTTVANTSGSATSIAGSANVSGAKSDISDTEDKPKSKATFDSDSESEDSDSAANIKRNGRKPASKSVSPEKKTNSGGSNAGKSYDYKTKLNYLFRGTHFYLIKSNNADNIAISKSKNVWATLPQNEANLNQAFKESRNVLLIFSVNESGKFAGFARMIGPSRRDLPHPAWILPPSISPKALGGIIELDWICRKELSFNCTSHLYNTWNEGKPVKIGRDGQEIEPKVGAELCRLFPEDEKVELTPILRKSKEAAKMMREKGIRVIYRPPRSLSARGGRTANMGYRHSDRRDAGGPMRHKRYGMPPHRPYKLPMSGPPGGFKRSSSPYRSGPGGPGGGGSSRAGGGDAGMPSWDRYMNSTAAEAYVVDYMRTMHGQLPPLPFVPPFAQLPLSAAGSGAIPPPGPPSMYDQIPPPVRYYDGPPLPDYPPPQPIRPPPPGFDKAPSYEDFAAWKNAGLPTVPDGMPPGFPNFGSSSLSNSNGSGGVGPSSSSGGGSSSFTGMGSMGGSSSIGGPNSYRNSSQRINNTNMNRSRERVSGRDYRGASGSLGGSASRSAGSGGHDRHFRAAGNERGGGHRNYRDARR